MSELLLWIYVANGVLLINHEIDSAYWKEWELFRMPGGAAGFVLLHIPLIFVVLLGLVLVARHAALGVAFSFFLSFAGIFAFAIHTYFLKKGREQFNTPVSKAMLAGALLVSIAQLVIIVTYLSL
jgi:hypothetical protein